ncbi:2-hydroxychromene-2-carboxylate isomerase [Parendozoicomonas haliclonae]|uniref:2-hydroxychromene-2-carboxylate isomerase n=1 Tax=Parendozoicomonas haliclonae TaxID=1960125 RepID=A0A1X7AK94_9GAMM|nr:2-hydroxychromene-2-carboxylate isomerase [Parendozoicomonas haliclonae]SMA47590.1 2-hydroxychromene-2-carboxylate isomerase [Parendozoicomonas haliclonae]
MNKELDFYFDVGSPTAYLAHERLKQLSQQYGLKVNYKPMLLGGVHKATGNQPPGVVPFKGKYMLKDIPRFARRYNVPMTFNSAFPINTLPLMRGALAAEQQGCFMAYVDTVFKAMWVNNKNMGKLEIIGEVLTEAGLDADALITATQDPAIKQALITVTEEAVAREVFGAPTLFMDGEMYFGQDRLDFIEEALQ